jgi:hypothetical protein
MATELISGIGVAPARASAMATHLLWFDAAGASSHGIATLPSWLGRIDRQEIDPTTRGKVILEHSGTAVFDAQQGLPPLALETAAGIASEKARDVGVGVVRVRNIGPTGPTAPVASGLAIGPFVAMIAGPSPSFAMALPTAEGLPAIYDSGLAGGIEPGKKAALPPEGWLRAFAPWVSTLAGGEGFLIVALSVPSMESLTAFHERADQVPRSAVESPSQFWPEALEARRRQARELGVTLDPTSTAMLREWAGRFNVPWPGEVAG